MEALASLFIFYDYNSAELSVAIFYLLTGIFSTHQPAQQEDTTASSFALQHTEIAYSRLIHNQISQCLFDYEPVGTGTNFSIATTVATAVIAVPHLWFCDNITNPLEKDIQQNLSTNCR